MFKGLYELLVLLMVMAAIGALTTVGATLYGVCWLIHHIIIS